MKYSLLVFFFCFLGFGQEKVSSKKVSVEKGLYGFDISPFGLFFSAENKLTNNIVLRSSLGYGGDLLHFESIHNGPLEHSYVTGILIELESRWYYNLKKREEKGKNIRGNSGDFLALHSNIPFKGTITSAKGNKTLDSNIFAIWGIKRAFKPLSDFYYEVLGGYGIIFTEYKNSHNLYLNIRLGYYLFR